MTLNLHELERGIGVDLFRRPFLTSAINSFMLRFFFEAFLQTAEDEDEYSNDYTNVGCTKNPLVERLAASAVFIASHFVHIIGLFESIFWIIVAVVYRAVKLPRVYAFEKLMLDISVILFKPTVSYVKKTIRFQCRNGQKIPKLQMLRTGFGSMVITVVSSTESLTRDARALMRMLRYLNHNTIAFWTEDSVIMVGVNKNVEQALCELGNEPALIDLGWHKDVIEKTNYKIEAIFTKERLQASDSVIKSVGPKNVTVEIYAQFATKNLELLVTSMDQFAAVCEAYERGLRMFNGKRVSIYVVGISISIALIVFYEGAQGLLKPSADVLTLAVGAFTLWMTLGKSAALGETEEETVYSTITRKNILLAYHGLAKIEENVVNTCWVPEIHQEERAPVPEGNEIDGSITLIEAAIMLSIFEHFGNLLKWKGVPLKIDKLHVSRGKEEGLVHVKSVERLANLNALQLKEKRPWIARIGAPKSEAFLDED